MERESEEVSTNFSHLAALAVLDHQASLLVRATTILVTQETLSGMVETAKKPTATEIFLGSTSQDGSIVTKGPGSIKKRLSMSLRTPSPSRMTWQNVPIFTDHLISTTDATSRSMIGSRDGTSVSTNHTHLLINTTMLLFMALTTEARAKQFDPKKKLAPFGVLMLDI